ncbi:hypothetical protein C2U69_27405 [Cupriavidus pinatubonensis]|nr:hypothetical protein C2U69_27405 [Cupriavidus pinatubonensis]
MTCKTVAFGAAPSQVHPPGRSPELEPWIRFGYDSELHPQKLPVLAKRRTEHGSGLGKLRWVVERT